MQEWIFSDSASDINRSAKHDTGTFPFGRTGTKFEYYSRYLYRRQAWQTEKNLLFCLWKKKLSNLIIIDVTKEITLGEERIYFSQHFIHLSHTYYVYDIQTITK